MNFGGGTPAPERSSVRGKSKNQNTKFKGSLTAGEGNTETGTRIVRPVPADADTTGPEVANTDEVANGVPAVGPSILIR